MTMTLNRLTEIKQKNQELVMVRKLVASQAEEMAKHTAYRKQILVCGGTGCTSSGSHKVIEALEEESRGIDALFEDPEISSDAVRLTELSSRKAALMEELETAYAEWETLEEG